jgi:hypothetical protein
VKLPDDSIGISDVLAHRECPRRFSYSMRRHTGRATQSDDRTPEDRNPATIYGSAMHDCIQAVEDGDSDQDAILAAFGKYGHSLEPNDAGRLARDLEKYRERDFPGTRTVMNEGELRLPLLTRDGKRTFFRARIDRLYERLDRPGHFIHVDYKSSRWRKTQQEVDDDPQMWTYNWALHEWFPEIEHLDQVYDQLRHGQLHTSKTPAQRREVRDWLEMQVNLVLDDYDVRDDGLLAHRYNEWCAYCPILESCPVVFELTDYALTRIAALAPSRKEGRRQIVDLKQERIGEYADELAQVRQAKTVLERFETSVAGLLREMPEERRAQLGWTTRDSGATNFTPRAAEALYERVGPERFFQIAKLTQAGLRAALADDDDLLAWALDLGEKVTGATSVVRRRDAT